MLATQLTGLKRILCLGAHSDDIEIGCGGTILKILAANPKVKDDYEALLAAAKKYRQ